MSSTNEVSWIMSLRWHSEFVYYKSPLNPGIAVDGIESAKQHVKHQYIHWFVDTC